MSHTLRIAHHGTHNASATPDANGNYTVAMVRKSLSDTEIVPANIRYNPTTNTVQTTPDAGATWVDAQGQDPRHDPTNVHPLRTGTAIQCNSAANMTAYIKQYFDHVIAATGAGALMVEALGLSGYILGAFGIVTSIIASWVASVFAIGGVTVNTAMTSTVYTHLTNILFCDIAQNGSVSVAQFAQIQTDVTAQIGGTAASLINALLSAWGEIGLQNAGTQGTVVGSCSGTGCIKAYKMTFEGGTSGAIFGGGILNSRGQNVVGYGYIASDIGTAESDLQFQVVFIGPSLDYQFTRFDIEIDQMVSPQTNGQGLQVIMHNNALMQQTLRTPPTGHSIWTVSVAHLNICHYINVSLYANGLGHRQSVRSIIVYWDASDPNAPTWTPNYP